MTQQIAIIGAAGRMGIALLAALQDDAHASLSHGLIREGSDAAQPLAAHGLSAFAAQLTSDTDAVIAASDVIIDFSFPELTLELATKAAAQGKAYVSGTTGFSPEQFAQFKALGAHIPIVWAANMSIGVNTLLTLVEQTAATLDDSYDIELTEMHHKHKKDAPSGTALALGGAAATGRNVALEEVATYSREGITGARERGSIGFSALRGGDVVGDHTVLFAGDGERIELTHKASDRSIYAKGALRAARWLENKQAGFYNMKDVLGL